MKNKPIWRAEQSLYRNAVDFLVGIDREHDAIVGQPVDILMVQTEPGQICQPTLSIQPEEAQQIINELWRIGFRPKDGSGAVAHTEALQRHLDDMRTIAFNRLKITATTEQE